MKIAIIVIGLIALLLAVWIWCVLYLNKELEGNDETKE